MLQGFFFFFFSSLYTLSMAIFHKSTFNNIQFPFKKTQKFTEYCRPIILHLKMEYKQLSASALDKRSTLSEALSEVSALKAKIKNSAAALSTELYWKGQAIQKSASS